MNFDILSVLNGVASETLVTLHVRILLDDKLNQLSNNSRMELGIH